MFYFLAILLLSGCSIQADTYRGAVSTDKEGNHYANIYHYTVVRTEGVRCEGSCLATKEK